MSDNIKTSFAYLADHPELLPILAEWFHTEWGDQDPQRSRETIQQEVSKSMHKNRLPLTIVCVREAQPIATATLKIREMETHPQYEHWLGGVYVHPEHRGQQVGSQIVEFTAQEAARLKVSDLYLYTRSHQGFYTRLGWQVIEEPHYKGRRAYIMKRKLSVENKEV